LKSIAERKKKLDKGENILILGAGLMQKPAILAVKALGYTAAVVDVNPDACCVPIADRFQPIDLKDKESIVQFGAGLRQEGGLAAVFTAGTDFSASVAYAAEKLGLPGHRYEAALNASIKTRMRSCFTAAGIPSPVFRRVNSPVPENLKDELSYPAVIKPVDNMGARGCRMIRTAAEFDFAVEAALQASGSGTAILEDYMDGPEYSIDAIVWNGSLTVTGFADRHIFFPPYFIEMGHTMPTAVGGRQRSELISTFALGVKALGLTCGAAKADIKYTTAGPMIGEIAARLSGGYMSGWTYPYASGCNLTEQALLVALGKQPDYLVQHRRPVAYTPVRSEPPEQPFELFELPCNAVSAERAWISIPGIVRKMTGAAESSGIPGVHAVFPRIGTGDEVVFPRNNVEKGGNVITAAADRKSAVAAACRAVSSITVELEPCNRATESFLTGKSSGFDKDFPPAAFLLSVQAEKEFLTYCSGPGRSEVIAADVPAGKNLPPCLNDESILDLEDWNHVSFRDSLARFDTLRRHHAAIQGSVFWSAFIKGGIQGALYSIDTAGENGEAW
jgi:biotin carboxylase